MKRLFLGCFLGNDKIHVKTPKRSTPPANTSSDYADAVTEAEAGLGTDDATEAASANACRTPGAPDARNHPNGASSADTRQAHRLPDSLNQDYPTEALEQQEAPVPRLSLDCGVGIGPGPPEPKQVVPDAAASNLSFTRLPGPSLPLALVVRGSVDTGSADTGIDSSDGSSVFVAVRGGAAEAALAAPAHPADLTTAGSRHLVSRALRGRASLDAMLMLGALVRAADEAGLAVSAIGGTPRLERIESGDLPPGEDGHAERQGQSWSSRSAAVAAAAEAEAAVARPEWCAEAARPPPRPQRCGRRWPPPLSGATGGDTAGVGGLVQDGSVGSGSSSAVGLGGAGSASAAAAAAVLGRCSDEDFTFSPPTVAGSARQSVDATRGPPTELGPGQQPGAHGNPNGTQLGGGPAADSNQVLELFMRLVTNCSTLGDNDLPSSSCGCDRSSAGTAGTGPGSRGVTGTGSAQGTLTTTTAVAAALGHRRQYSVQRSVTEWQRHANGKRSAAADGSGGGSAASSSVTGSPQVGGGIAAAAGPRPPPWLRAAVDRAAVLNLPEAGSSAPLLKVYGNLGGSYARGGGAAGGRRNSWDTPGGSSNSAVAMAAAAAAALAAAGLLRASASSRNGGGGGRGSNSGKNTGSAARFWPAGGVLQEDSGPASMLLLGALSGGMSLGGNNSTNSLVRLPTGSGSVRDVLTRIHQGQQQGQQGPAVLLRSPHVPQEGGQGGNGGTSSSSWSAQTGLASLFDAHLTAALRRNGAVRTFQCALGGPAALSHASSTNSQMLNSNLRGQDTSLTLTSGLMMLHFGSTAGSSSAAVTGAGVSQLGAASAATAAAAGILVSGLMPRTVRRATISSISTIHSSPQAGSGALRRDAGGDDGDDDDGGGGGTSNGAQVGGALAPPAGLRPAYRVLPRSEGGSAAEANPRAQMHKQLRAFVERQHPQPSASPQPHPQQRDPPHPQQEARRHNHQQLHQQQQDRNQNRHQHHHNHIPQQQQSFEHSPFQSRRSQGMQPPQTASAALPGVGGPGGSGPGTVPGAAGAPAPPGARNPSGNSGVPNDQRYSLSLALGLATGMPISASGGGRGGRATADAVVDASALDYANRPAVASSPPQYPPSPPTDVVAARLMAARSLAAGPVVVGWLQSQGHAGPSGRGGAGVGSERSASLDFSHYSWETEWGAPVRGQERGDTFTFTGPGEGVDSQAGGLG